MARAHRSQHSPRRRAVEAPGFVYMGNRSAERMADFEIRPVVVQPTKRAVLSRHGYRAAQFEDAFARFLPPEPNIRTLKRRGGEKT